MRKPPGPRILPTSKSGEDRNMVNWPAAVTMAAPPLASIAIRKPKYTAATVKSLDLAISPFFRASASFFGVGSWVFSPLSSRFWSACPGASSWRCRRTIPPCPRTLTSTCWAGCRCFCSGFSIAFTRRWKFRVGALFRQTLSLK